MREYDVPENDSLISDAQGLYVNYPYNDLRPDIYFTSEKDRTEGCDNVQDSVSEYPPLSGYRQDIFSFHSPELMFTRPFLNANETKIYGEIHGNSSGKFIPSEQHPGQKLLRNISSVIAGIVGLGYAIRQVQGTPNTTALPTQALNTAYPEWQNKIKDRSGGEISGGGGFVSLTVPPGVATVNLRDIDGDEQTGGGTDDAQDGGEYLWNNNNQKEGQTIDGETLTASTRAYNNIERYLEAGEEDDGSAGLGELIGGDFTPEDIFNLLEAGVDYLSQTFSPPTDVMETLNALAIKNIDDAQKFGDGFMGGGASTGVTKDTADSNIPVVIKRLMKFMLLQKKYCSRRARNY